MDEKKGALSGGKKSEGGEKKSEHKMGGGGKHPHMHIHSHEAGHTMHVMHDDGSHEMHHFAQGDTAGMKSVMDEHMGGAGGGMMGGGAGEGEGGGAAEPEQEQAA